MNASIITSPLFLFLAALLGFSFAFSTTKLSSSASSSSSISIAHHDDIDLIRLRPESVNDILRNIIRHQQVIDNGRAGEATNHPRSQVMLDGVVSKRRVIGKHLVFLDVIPMELPTFPISYSSLERKRNATIYEAIESIVPVNVILMRDFWNNHNADGNSPCSYDVYHKITQPGVHIKLTGHVGLSRNEADGAVIFCHTLQYTLLNDNPQHLQTVLRCAQEGILDINEVMNAIPLLRHDELTTNYPFSERASEILDRFPKNYLFNPSKLMGSTNSQKRNLLPLAPPEFITAGTHFGDGNMSTVSGEDRNRRRYQGYITVLKLVDPVLLGNDIATWSSKEFGTQQLSVILHPNVLKSGNGTSIELSKEYGNILSSGASVSVQGYMTTGSSEIAPILWVSSCRMLRSSWRPNAVRQVLDALHAGKIAVDEAADALKLPGGYNQAEDIAKGITSITERQWLAAELTQSLQGQHSRLGMVTSLMKQSLAFFAYAGDEYPIEHVHLKSELDLSLRATPLLQSNNSNLRLSSVGTRWQRAKMPQLKFMIEQIGTVLRSHPEYGERKLKVVDIGGGRGLLSNLLAELFGDFVEVQVVDISRSATNNGMMRAKRRGLQNIQYTAVDATVLDVEGVDVVVALHACGALADVALGHAASQGAGFVVCPCCYLSNPHLQVSAPTASNNHSNPITVEQWLMVDPIKYEQLKRTAEVQGDIKLASEAMHTVCGLRSIAVNRLWQGRSKEVGLTIKIKRFPIAFSTRNFCIIGSFNQIQPRG